MSPLWRYESSQDNEGDTGISNTLDFFGSASFTQSVRIKNKKSSNIIKAISSKIKGFSRIKTKKAKSDEHNKPKLSILIFMWVLLLSPIKLLSLLSESL